MGSTYFHAFALIFSVTALVLTVGALFTTSWITASLSFDTVLSAIKRFHTSADSGLDVIAKMHDGIDIIFKQGLIRESLSVGHLFTKSFFVDGGKVEAYILVVTATFVSAVILTFTGIYILADSVRGGDSYEEKSANGSKTRTAMIVLSVSGLFLLFGMALYTGASAKEIHNPTNFKTSFQNAGQSWFISLAKRNKIFQDRITDYSQVASEVLQEIDPVRGHCFLVGWAASVLTLISAVLAAFGRYYLVQRPYGMTVKA